ncbi:MAG: hypothetical protein ABF697_08430 [Zymomonas mobilis]|uniref:hypothetical protein n=1 Tax=Zymomonas mobilis TaxID=542 RepID=UPI0039E8ECAB
MGVVPSNIPEKLKGRYPEVECESSKSFLLAHSINELNKMPIQTSEASTSSFKVFAHEFNSVMLTAHLFENLLMLEDVRHENNGHDWFQIEIPEEYFRYPAENDPRNYGGQDTPRMSDEDRRAISAVVRKSKEMANYANDENFAKNNLHKLEFISIFSFLESFIENVQVEVLGVSREDASKSVRYASLPNAMEGTFEKIDPDINIFIKNILYDFYDFMKFSYLLRNLHSHNLGRVTQRFFDMCEKEGLLKDDYGIKEDGEKIFFGKIVRFTGYRRTIELDKYINLSDISFVFRNYARECIFIAEQYIEARVQVNSSQH